MIDPEDDAELAKAIQEHTIQVDDPTPPDNPAPVTEGPPPENEPVLGHDAADFRIDVPPPEGI